MERSIQDELLYYTGQGRCSFTEFIGFCKAATKKLINSRFHAVPSADGILPALCSCLRLQVRKASG